MNTISSVTTPIWSNSLTFAKSNFELIDDHLAVFKVEGTGLVFDAEKIQLSKDSENLEDRIQRLEQMLGVTGRNSELEDKYPDLKAIGEQMDREVTRVWRESASKVSMIANEYQDFIEQCQLMDKLKENNDP